MAEVLVLVEHADGAVAKTTGEALAAARTIGAPCAVVVGEPGTAEAVRPQLASWGAEKIYAAELEAVNTYLVAPSVEILAQLMRDKAPAAVVIAAGGEGKEIAGRLAVAVGSGVLTGVTALNADGTAAQTAFAGTTLVTSRVTVGTPIYAIRPKAFAPQPVNGYATIEAVAATVSEKARRSQIVKRVVEASGERPDLTEADVVVAGGRGVGNAENFALIEQLADALGGAVGASRAATDSGYYPHQFQVGQTGQTVSPQLYIAAGISGAIQHRAGMQTSKTIVAINTDAEAPIFELADFGVVGDLFHVIPPLIEEIKQRKK